MKASFFNSANIFIIVCCFDRLLPIFIPGNPVNSLLHWSIILMSFYYAYKVCTKNYINQYVRYLSLLVIMFLFYGILHYLFGPTYLDPTYGFPMNKLSYTTTILKSLLPIYPFYYFTIKGQLTEKQIKKWVVVFFIVALIVYMYMLQSMQELKGFSNDVTNNAGYYIVSFIPLLVFFESKKILQYLLLLICLLLVILSMKRGAILSCAMMIGFFIMKSLKYASMKQKAILVFFVSILVFGVYYYISTYMMDNIYFLSRIADTLEGNTSNRDSLYGSFWTHICESGFLKQLLGGGANYTLKVSYNYAHNDWLEIGVNQGLLGVTIFFLYWFSFYKSTFRKLMAHPYNIMIGMVFIDFFIRTFFSMSYSEHTFYTNISIGYCMGIQVVQFRNKNFRR